MITPDAAGIQCNGVRVVGLALECCPVAKNNGVVLSFSLGEVEPGYQPLGCLITFTVKVHTSISMAKAQASKVVGDDSKARHAGEVILPLIGLVAVHGL